MRGAIPLLPLHVFVAWPGNPPYTFTFQKNDGLVPQPTIPSLIRHHL